MKARRSSIYFFGTMFLSLLCVPLMLIIPEFKGWEYLPYWWVVLVPVIILKMLHITGIKTILFTWLNTEIWIQKKQ